MKQPTEEKLDSISTRIKLSMEDVNELTKETVLQEINNSKSFMAFYTDEKGNCKLFHAGNLEDRFGTVLALLHRHISFYDFFKSVIMNIDRYKAGGELEGLKFTPKALNYLRMKKRNFNQPKGY